MIVTIIDGSLPDFLGDEEQGSISINEESLENAMEIARTFILYGKTVVIEPEGAEGNA